MSQRAIDPPTTASPHPTDLDDPGPGLGPSPRGSHPGLDSGGAVSLEPDPNLNPKLLDPDPDDPNSDLDPDPYPESGRDEFAYQLPLDERPTPLLFQPLSPLQSQCPSSPSAPPSISSLPSNSVSASRSPSIGPYVHHTSPNPFRLGIGPSSSLLSRQLSRSPRPGSSWSSTASSVQQHNPDYAEQTPVARRYTTTTTTNGDMSGTNDIDDVDDEDSVSRDSRDVLAQRLTDLAQQVSLLADHDLGALHAKVDELERSLASRGHSSGGQVCVTPSTRRFSPFPAMLRSAHSQPPHHHHPYQSRSPSGDFTNAAGNDLQGDRFWQGAGPAGRSPSWLRSRLSDISPLAKHGQGQPISPSIMGMGLRLGPWASSGSRPNSVGCASVAGDMDENDSGSKIPDRRHMVPAEDMKRFVDEAERLNSELGTLITNFRARQEESNHIHSLLIERAERAAQRILFLQARVTHLENELQENDSELQNLRLQLKAIEVQYPPPDVMDADLRRSIENWKSDWARLRQKRAAKVKEAATSLFYDELTGTSGLASVNGDNI